MKKKIALIIIPIFLITVLVIYLGLMSKENNKYSFAMEGYILTSPNFENNETTKYYFNSGSSYEKKYSNKILFKDVDGNKVTIPNESFIHYVDGSISIMKKSVILNLNELNSTVIKYYNLFEKTILQKNNTGYSIDNGGNKLQLSDFIVKISDNKYLIVSDNLKVRLDDDKEIEVKDYLEVTFADGNVTRMENQQVSYQTISSLSYIKVDSDTVIKTGNQGIYVKNERKMSLGQMVIDADDNIDIIPDEEKDEEDSNQTNDDSQSNSQGGSISGNDNEQIVDDTTKLKTPVFVINYMDVTSNKIDTNISIVDDDNLLSGLIKVKIYENSNWKTVYYTEDSTGLFEINVLVENLKPETSYTLVIESSYTILDTIYEKEFISKSFRTESLGISIDKYYYTKTSLNYKVKVDDYSDVKSLNVKLYNAKGELQKTIPVDTLAMQENEIDETSVIFDELTNDTGYLIEMGDILYNNSIISNYYSTVVKAKTLKEKPTFGQLSYDINKAKSTFSLSINSVSDNDHGISNYRYEIYDARTLAETDIEPVAVYEKNTLGPLDVIVDENSLYRGVPYVFKLVTSFYDNEKTYEYESSYSEVFKMEGVEFPNIRFEEDVITFERIKGIIYLNDTGNTVSLNSDDVITVVYANTSVGIVNSYTTAGNLTIPIDFNNLRANETYTISVYATIDLQDDNAAIDNCFIGSIVVNTKATNPFVANFVNVSSSSDSFNIRSILGTEAGIDNTLEASTLTGITFNLYSGQNTTTAPIKTVRKIDRDLREYDSELKSDYYDQEFSITPSFFGLSNADLTSDYYTVEIKQAYDYTTYQNDIPIKNSSVSVKVVGTPPPMPPSTNQSMEINVIYNKNAGDKYNPSLNAETIVGYRIKANYDNSRNYAKYITYHIHNEITSDILSDYDVTMQVEPNSDLSYVEFYLKNGSAYGSDVIDFVRGNKYYFSYSAALDLDGDGTVETQYPKDISTSGQEYVISETISPQKQSPIIKMYPSTSTKNSMMWKYKISDIDQAFYENDFIYKIGENETWSNVSIVKNSDDYALMNLTDLSNGFLDISYKQALINDESQISNVQFIYQYFDSEYILPDLTFSTILQNNRIIIQINNYKDNEETISKITGLKLVFTSGTNEVILDNQVLNNGSVTVDLEKIATLINHSITINAIAYYDSGLEGFDTDSDKFTVKSILNSFGGGQYYVIDKYFNLYAYDKASGAIYNRVFTDTSLYLKNLLTLYEKTYDISIDHGVSFNKEYLSLKKIATKELIGDGTETFTFDMIIPGISLLGDNGIENIAPGLKEVELYIKLYGAGAEYINPQTLYIDIYETDKSGLSSKHLKQEVVSISALNESIIIEGLSPKTYYYFEVSANVGSNGTYTKTKLYDVDEQSTEKLYYFTTLDNIGISTATASYRAIAYDNKYIAISYNVDRTVGYDRISYEVYKYVTVEGVITKELIDLDITDDTMFSSLMTKQISINPGSVFEFGCTYDIVIKPYTAVTINGVLKDIELNDETITYVLRNPLNPFVGVSSVTANSTTNVKVSVYDIGKIIVNGTYTIKIIDENENDITPLIYKNVDFQISNLNATFSIPNLESNSIYTFIVIMILDKDNDMTTTVSYESLHSINTPNQTGISIGDVYAVTNHDDNEKIDLTFYNSTKIDEIEEIRYSIYNVSGYVVDNQIAFTPQQNENSEGVYYKYNLPDRVTESGIYHIEMQFLSNGNVVETLYIQYNLS